MGNSCSCAKVTDGADGVCSYHWSSSCTCDRLPSTLFRVSKAMNKLATRTYYLQNQFFVRSSPTTGIASVYNAITRLPRHKLRYIRYLRLDVRESRFEREFQAIGTWTALFTHLTRYGHPNPDIQIVMTGGDWGIYDSEHNNRTIATRTNKIVKILHRLGPYSIVFNTRVFAHCMNGRLLTNSNQWYISRPGRHQNQSCPENRVYRCWTSPLSSPGSHHHEVVLVWSMRTGALLPDPQPLTDFLY
ncbi:hypothetical protein BU16DRAFT_285790 [Lophium mytilinum]|uniref:Uncharacterized protein n=1 Tax=Lophium mytilinum TaxID=390894 RepID=A0A6A6R817_9PEZI|nr:hypothetical protein BU16DRAFT_285790 [Lophium mytilinum]